MATVHLVPPARLKYLISVFHNFDAVTQQALTDAFAEFAPIFQEHLVGNSGDSGRFATSWTAGMLTPGPGMLVENTFSKARFVEYPTRPHLILPRAGGVLSWVPPSGLRVFAKRVNHPGFRGRNVFATTMANDIELFWGLVEHNLSVATHGGGDGGDGGSGVAQDLPPSGFNDQLDDSALAGAEDLGSDIVEGAIDLGSLL